MAQKWIANRCLGISLKYLNIGFSVTGSKTTTPAQHASAKEEEMSEHQKMMNQYNKLSWFDLLIIEIVIPIAIPIALLIFAGWVSK